MPTHHFLRFEPPSSSQSAWGSAILNDISWPSLMSLIVELDGGESDANDLEKPAPRLKVLETQDPEAQEPQKVGKREDGSIQHMVVVHCYGCSSNEDKGLHDAIFFTAQDTFRNTRSTAAADDLLSHDTASRGQRSGLGGRARLETGMAMAVACDAATRMDPKGGWPPPSISSTVQNWTLSNRDPLSLLLSVQNNICRRSKETPRPWLRASSLVLEPEPAEVSPVRCQIAAATSMPQRLRMP
jgi:hypothetical protein